MVIIFSCVFIDRSGEIYGILSVEYGSGFFVAGSSPFASANKDSDHHVFRPGSRAIVAMFTELFGSIVLGEADP
jgi:hypothetical protein